MDMAERAPFIVYDDRCGPCTGFARIVSRLCRIPAIGHYSEDGVRVRKQMLDESALEMFWYVDKGAAYGGRAAIPRLARRVIAPRTGAGFEHTVVQAQECNTSCSGARSVAARCASMISNHKIIRY